MKKQALDQIMYKRVDNFDKLFLDPAERADLVNTLICTMLNPENPSKSVSFYWDLICFSLETLNLYTKSFCDDEIISIMRAINNQIYSTHYSFPQDHIYMIPREDHKEFYNRILEAMKGEDKKDGV